MTGFWTPDELADVEALVGRGYSEPQLRHLVVRYGESVSTLLELARRVPPAVLEEVLAADTSAVDALRFLLQGEESLSRVADLRRLAAAHVPLAPAAALLDLGAPISDIVALRVLGVDLAVAARMWDALGACSIEVRQAAIAIASCPDPVSDQEAIAAARALYPPPAPWTPEQARRVRRWGATFEQAADMQEMRLDPLLAEQLLECDSPDTILELLVVGARPDELLALQPLGRRDPDQLAAAFAQLDGTCRRDEFVTFVRDGMDAMTALSAARANERLTMAVVVPRGASTGRAAGRL